MNLLEAINQRKSRRSYLNIPIGKSNLDIIQKLIDECNNKNDLTIQLIEDGSSAFNGLRKSYGMFKNVRTLIALKGKKEDINVKEKLGYHGELIILESTILGLGTCWVGGTFDKNDRVFNLNEEEEMSCVITIGHVSEDMSFKENMIRKMAHGRIKPLEHFYESDITPPQWFIDGIKAVQVAPSAVNKQDYKFTYEKNTIKAFTNNRSPYSMIDLGIAKAHFAIATNGRFEYGNPGLYKR